MILISAFGLMGTMAFAQSGSCGANLTWTYSNETLTISGTGDMYNYAESSSPWDFQRANIKTVIIGNSVTSIGGVAFWGCSFASITIPNSVTSIGEAAFCNCSNLTSITIPNSVTSIGVRAFSNCSNLTSITIPNSVTSIGNSAFLNCYSLTSSVEIPNSVTTIGNGVFSNCSIAELKTPIASAHGLEMSLKKIVITGVPSTIENSAFKNCYNLTSIEIPSSVTSIGNSAFRDCGSLTSVTIPEGVTSIGNNAFYGCSSLTSVTIPEGVTSIGDFAFYGCSSLTSTILNSVTSIGINAFYGCSSLTSIEIPNSVTSIEAGTFYGCRGLTSIEIPNSVTSIGNSAFYGCRGLTSMEIPNSVTSIGNNAFFGCSSLTSITLPFVGTSETAVNQQALFGRVFGSDLYTGGTATQQNYSSTASVTYYIPTALKNVTITGGILNYGAFSNCTMLSSVTLGDNVSIIGEQAFAGCNSLTAINVGSGNGYYTSENGVLFNKNKTFLHIYPARKAGDYVIPNGVTSIGASAFQNCIALSSVSIPSSVISIGASAFSGCSSLLSITNQRATPQNINANVFDNTTYANALLFVPASAQTSYKAATGWKNFANIEPVYDNVAEYGITLQAMPANGGVVSGGGTYQEGTNRTVTATANTGYTFVNWLENGVAVSNNANYSFSVNANRTLTAVFRETPRYNISLTATAGGSVTGNGTFQESTYHTITATASNSYTFVNWLENGIVVSRNASYSFEVHSNRNLQAVFVETQSSNVDVSNIEIPTDRGVAVVPTDNNAVLAWNAVDNATNYTLVISQNGTVICALEFDAAGRLLSLSFGNQTKASGDVFGFKVTNLEENTTYQYNLQILGENETVLETKTGEFTTTGSGVGIVETWRAASLPSIIGYYSLTGAKLAHEPEKGMYIILYDNGMSERRVR